MDDFIKALQQSQTLPDLPSNEAAIPDPFKGSNVEALVKAVTAGTAGKIPGAAEYAFEYKCARLTIGKEMSGFIDGQATFDDIDESQRLKEIMDMSLSGETVITKKTETFLKDGTVVLWIEWLEPKAAPPKKDREYLTVSELLVPESKPADSEEDDKYPDTDDDYEP
jgi:hypothetical protein